MPRGYQQQHKGFWSFKLQNASQKPYSPLASGLREPVAERGAGEGRNFWRIPGYSFICVWALGGEEKAGFGAQPRDFDTILPCPGNISNNIKGFGASNFKMLLRSPIPQWYLASQGPLSEGGGGGECHLEAVPGYSFICVYIYIYPSGGGGIRNY